MKTKLPATPANLENQTARILAVGLLAVLLLALAGCKNAATVATEPPPAGVYTLVSVDGKNVPCNLTHEAAAMTVKSGSLTFTADGTCRSLTTSVVPPHPDIHRDVAATYTQNGAELILHWTGAGTTQGRINGNEFTLNNEGMIFVYRK